MKAKKFFCLIGLKKGGFIKCYGTGKNNRIPAAVNVDKKNAILRLVMDGFAEAYQARHSA